MNRIRSRVPNKIVCLTLITSLLRFSGKMLCFYNGNGFGRAGFGYAVAEDSEGSQARAAA